MVGYGFTILSETPCADPHAGCCGGWGLETSGYPIMYVAFTLGVLLWCIYGFSHGQISIIASNGITLALASVILGMKLRYR